MALIAQTIDENKELESMLKSPVIKLEKKEKVLKSIFGKSTEPLSLRFMLLVAKKGREEYLVYFAHEFTEIFKDYKGLIDAWVSSSVSMDKEIKDTMLVLLKKISVRLSFYMKM